MNKAIAALCVGLILAAAAGPASARIKHRNAPSAPVAHGAINTGWGPPMTWDDIEVSHPEGAG